MKPLILYNKQLCTGCGACVASCPVTAITMDQDSTPITDNDACTICGKCCDECYFLARKMSSKIYTVDEVFDLVMKDEVVYKNSGGGVTISGGEPLLQREFNVELFKRCKEAGIGTAVETAGYVPFETIEEISKYTDTFLFDCKIFTEELHKEWIGTPNKLILDNIKKLTDIHDNVVIRIPLIPNVNDTDEEFTKIVNFIKTLRRINSVHILPFHHFGAGKYDLAGMNYEMADVPEETEENAERCKQIALKAGLRVSIGGTGFKDDRKITDEKIVKMKESFIYE